MIHMSDEGGLDQEMTVELMRTGYVGTVKSIGFANTQYGEGERQHSEKMSRFYT